MSKREIDFVRSNEQEPSVISSRLLDVAIDHFGRRGFDGASTRAIAKDSGTAMSSITYHFGGKEGLYLAAADHIAARIAEMQGQFFDPPKDVDSMTVDQARGRILAMLDGMAMMMLAPETESWSRFIVREQQAPTEAFERIYAGIMRPMSEMFVTLLGKTRPDLDEAQRRVLAVTMIGQVIVLRVGRASVCRILGVQHIGPEENARLRDRVRANLLCLLSEGNS